MQLRGTASEIPSKISSISPDKKLKGEFVLVVEKKNKF